MKGYAIKQIIQFILQYCQLQLRTLVKASSKGGVSALPPDHDEFRADGARAVEPQVLQRESLITSAGTSGDGT
jgi:hypothetical protein